MVDYNLLMANIKWPRGIHPIPRHEGYGVTRSGSVYWHDPYGNTFQKKSLYKGHDGYTCVSLGKYGKKKLHRLLLMTFDRYPKPGEVCRHLDGNPSNNSLKNLKWGTQKDNAADRVRHGTGVVPRFSGEDHPHCRFSDEDLRLIRSLKDAVTRAELAAMFDISEGYLSRVLNNKIRTNGD